MKRHFLMSVGALVLVALASTPAFAQALKATLDGYQEIPMALSTPGTGRCTASVNKDQQSIKMSLSYSDLEAPVLQAHIHFGRVGVNGGIMLFFCTNLVNGPVGTPLCDPVADSIERTVVADDVVGPAGQGIAAGEISEVVAALRNRTAYCNVHTEKYTGGEIRGNMH